MSDSWNDPNRWKCPMTGHAPAWPRPPNVTKFDTFYFLEMQGVGPIKDKLGSAVLRFSSSDTKLFHQDIKVDPKEDEFVIVAENGSRNYPGIMYNVKFEKIKAQFQCMIFPGADAAEENHLIGYIAKLEDNCARSRMMPVYRAEKPAVPFMQIGDWVLRRQYYATWAPPATTSFTSRCGEYLSLPAYNYKTMPTQISKIAPGEGDPDAAEFVPNWGEVEEIKASQFATVEFEDLPSYEFGSKDDPDAKQSDDLGDVSLFDKDDLAATADTTADTATAATSAATGTTDATTDGTSTTNP